MDASLKALPAGWLRKAAAGCAQSKVVSAFAGEMDGDALGVWQDVFFEGDLDAAERVVGEKPVGSFEGEGFDELARFCGGELLEGESDGVVVDCVGDVVGEAKEALAGDHADGEEECLWGGAFFVRDADVGAKLEAADLDGVGVLHRESGCVPNLSLLLNFAILE